MSNAVNKHYCQGARLPKGHSVNLRGILVDGGKRILGHADRREDYGDWNLTRK